MSAFVGVDAGASHTEAVAADQRLRPIGRARGPRGAVGPGRAEAAAQVIATVIGAALLDAGLETADAVVVGAAGAGRETERAALEGALGRALGAATRVRVTTDAAVALEAAFPDEAGLVLTAGTGSIAYARDAQGVVWRVGGHGWQFGDDGSGYALARAALGAIARAADGRGPDTTLTARVAGTIGVTTLDEMIRWAAAAPSQDVAALARTVREAANEGDAVAATLVRRTAEDLGRHLKALVQRLPSKKTVPLALAGGLLGEDSAVRRELEAWIARELPMLRVTPGVVDPVLGALSLAARL